MSRFNVEIQGPFQFMSEGRYQAKPNTNFQLRFFNYMNQRVNVDLIIDRIPVARTFLQPMGQDITKVMQVKEYGDVTKVEVVFTPCVGGIDQVWGGIRPSMQGGLNSNALAAGLGGYSTWTQYQGHRTQNRMGGFGNPSAGFGQLDDPLLFSNEDLVGQRGDPSLEPETMVFFIINPQGTAFQRPIEPYAHAEPTRPPIDQYLSHMATNLQSEDRNRTWYSIDPGSRNHPFQTPFG